MIIIAIAGVLPTWNQTSPAAMVILKAIETILMLCAKLVIRKSIGLWQCLTSWELTKLPAPLTYIKEVIRSLKTDVMSFSQKDLDLFSLSTRMLEYNKIVSNLSSCWHLTRPNSQHYFSMSLVKPQSRWFNSQESSRLQIRKFSKTTKTPPPRLSSPPRIRRRWLLAIMSKGLRTLKIQILLILKWTQQFRTWMCTLKKKIKRSECPKSWPKQSSHSQMPENLVSKPMLLQPTFLHPESNIGIYAKLQSSMQ